MPTILAAIDLSLGSDRVLRRATILARESGSSMRLLHVLEEPNVDAASSRTASEASHLLGRIANAISEFDGIACDSQVVFGNAAEQIAIAAEQARASLVVTGPHKQRHLLDLISGPTAEALAMNSSVPVLMANKLPALGYSRILIPTGLDPASVQIVESIAACPLRRVPQLFMVYILESVSSLRFGSTQDREEYLREEHQSGQSALRDFLAENQLADRVRGQVRLNRSTTGREIEDAAVELGCDIVAISYSQKPLLEKLIAGSVAQAVVREVDSDIAIFP